MKYTTDTKGVPFFSVIFVWHILSQWQILHELHSSVWKVQIGLQVKCQTLLSSFEDNLKPKAQENTVQMGSAFMAERWITVTRSNKLLKGYRSLSSNSISISFRAFWNHLVSELDLRVASSSWSSSRARLTRCFTAFSRLLDMGNNGKSFAAGSKDKLMT